MAILDQLTGMALAYYGYDNSAIPVDKLVFQVPQDWIDVEDSRYNGTRLSTSLGANYNIQTNGSGAVENRFAVFINEKMGQIAISIKGSDAWSNWVSDLANAGASEFAKIQDQLQAALIQLHADYPGYQIIATGHSLGGAMAQAFGVRNDLDIAVYNSLPIPKGVIDSGYFGDADPKGSETFAF